MQRDKKKKVKRAVINVDLKVNKIILKRHSASRVRGIGEGTVTSFRGRDAKSGGKQFKRERHWSLERKGLRE